MSATTPRATPKPTASPTDDCLFCKIVAGKIPCQKIYENTSTLAFLSINPVNFGHVLVVPKKHSADLLDTDDTSAGDIMIAAKHVASAVMKSMGAEGFNVSMNNKGAAGQVIFHAHVHIIPRFSTDGFRHWSHKETTPAQLEETAKKIRAAL